MRTGYLGIDVGSSGVRATVIDKSGALLASASDRVATAGLAPPALSSLMDGTVKLAMSHKTDIKLAALAVCAFGPAPIFLNDAGRVLGLLPMFAPYATHGSLKVGDDDLDSRVKSFRREEPRSYAAARIVCDVTGYLVWRLTGRMVMDTLTAKDFSKLSLPKRVKLPVTGTPLDQAGVLSRAAARRLGLPHGIPVVFGTYDSVGDLAATGFGAWRRTTIVLGSTLVLGVLTDRQVRDPSLRSMSHLGEGWFTGGWTNCAGSSLLLANQLLAQVGMRTQSTPLVLPYFSGERAPIWSRQATGFIAGISATTTAADLHHAFIQGVALSAADIASRIEAECGKVGEWVVTGGGTRNHVLMAELADALGARLAVIEGAHASLGPAVLAARSCGVDIRIPVAERYRGGSKRHAVYQDRLRTYRRLYSSVAPLMGEIARATGQGRKTK